MRRLRGLPTVFMLLVVAVASAAADQGLSTKRLDDWIRNNLEQIPSDKTGSCRWKTGHSLNFVFSFTNKGNGTLLIGGQTIRIYDAHEDGCRYESQSMILQIDLTVANGTPLLALSGMAQWTDDKGKAVIRREPILVLLALSKRKQLDLVFENEGAVHAGVILTEGPKTLRKDQSEWTEIIQRETEEAQANPR